MPYYLWRMTESENWMVLDANRFPPGEDDELWEFEPQAKLEADRRNRARKNGEQGELIL